MRFKNQKKSKRKYWRIGIVSTLLLFFGIAILYMQFGAYPNKCPEALDSTESVLVKKTDFGYFFDGPGEQQALIFYPGAMVDETAYALLLREISQGGVDCFLVRMPLHIAFFGPNKATQIRKDYSYEEWYMAGHSLGGVLASDFAAKHCEEITGVIFLASYPVKDLKEKNLSILSLYGSLDGVLREEKFRKAKEYLPEGAQIVAIEGGNHGQFGTYGFQKGDRTAEISTEEQIKQTSKQILSFVLE